MKEKEKKARPVRQCGLCARAVPKTVAHDTLRPHPFDFALLCPPSLSSAYRSYKNIGVQNKNWHCGIHGQGRKPTLRMLLPDALEIRTTFGVETNRVHRLCTGLKAQLCGL